MKKCMGVMDEVQKKIGGARRRAQWNVLEFGGSGRLQKRKEVKKEKCKGTCVKEKKKGKKKKRNVIRGWRIKKEGKKGKKKEETLSQYFYNTFTINFKW